MLDHAVHAGAVHVSWDPRLIALSCLVAVLASYASLDFASVVSLARKGPSRASRLLLGALAVGLGIWSMSFTGTLAFDVGVAVSYSAPLVAASALAAVGASSLALFVASRERLTVATLLLSSCAMAFGFAGMHYLGMTAMRMSAEVRYDLYLVALSIAIAVGASITALWLAFSLRGNRATSRARWAPLLKLGGAVFVGGAIAGMHYTGMAARYHRIGGEGSGGSVALAEPLTLGFGIGAVTLLFLALAGSFVSGRLALKARELEEYEQRYSSLFRHNPDAAYSADLLGNITAANPAAEGLTGYSAPELVGKNCADLLVPEERAEAARRFRLAASREAQTYETAITTRGGERVEVSVTSLPTVVAGEPRGVYSVVKDVTARKRAEAALVGRNDHLAALRETAMEFMGRKGTEAVLSSIVSRAARLVGVRSGYAFLVEPGVEETGIHAALGVYARDGGRYRMRRGQGLGGRVWESGELVVVNDYRYWGGRRRWPDDVEKGRGGATALPTAVVAVPIKSVGEVVGVMALAREDGGVFGDEEVALLENFADFAAVALHNARLYDAAEEELAERRRAEREVRELSRYNRSLFEVNLDGLAALSLTGGFEDANPAMSELANLPRAKRLEVDLPSLAVDPEDAQAALRLVREQGYLRDHPLTLKRRGTTRPVPVLLDATLFRDAGGEVAGILVSVRDITERAESEKKLKEAENEYRSLVEQIPVVTYTQEIEHNNGTSYISPQIEALVGHTPEEYVQNGELWISLLHPEDRERVIAEDERTDASGEPFRMEYRMSHRSGRTV